MSALYLIGGDDCHMQAPAPSIRLDSRTRRPGLAHEQLELSLHRPAAQRLASLRATDRLPAPLLAVIAIESERALGAAASEKPAVLARRLDWAARRAAPACVRRSQLAAYAAALRDPEVCEAGREAAELELLVPYHTLLAWEIAAAEAQLPLRDWARAQLVAAGSGRRLWEAAAADRGETLGEWVARQIADAETH